MSSQTYYRQSQYIILPDARKRDPLPQGEVKIRAPKAAEKPPAKPGWITLLLSAATPLFMGVAFFQSNTNAIFGVVSIVTAFALPLAQIWKYRQDLKQHTVEEAARIAQYRDYLKRVKEEIVTAGQEQQRILWQENPAITEMFRRVERRSSQLWQRLPGDDDFLAARIGGSNLPVSIKLIMPDKDLEAEPLLEDIVGLDQAYSTVPDLPVTSNLEQVGALGIRGRGETVTLEMAYTILAHLVTHHSPATLQLAVISHRRDAEQHWRWVRWLPHTGVVQGENSAPRLSFHIDQDEGTLTPLAEILQQRLEHRQSGQHMGEVAAHFVVVFDQLATFHHHRLIQMLLMHQPRERQPSPLRASALFIDRIPPQVQALLELQDEVFEYRELISTTAMQKPIRGAAELTSRARIARLARVMAPLRIESSGQAGGDALPRNVRLVELLGATQPIEVNLTELYGQVYDPRKIMAFPIGVNIDLKPLTVVLREDGRGGHGPHAMLAGATGKGKSVTLQSIVLALAATNSPEHLNIVLADFKGGASELARLKALPHVVGFVTDLDEAYVERFRLSLEGEVRRRKRLLEETPALVGRQIPDIYEFNQAMPDRLLPHLVVVIDEFAKALQINPAFKTTLDKDIAAQGRALGIHLILSTQKAADFAALRPNLEVRMSMQVQSSEDSRIIFSRTDAHSKLTRAGQAFLQVGDNRVFEMFQVAHTHMPYQPEGAAIDLVDDFQIRQVLPNGSRRLLYAHKARETVPDNGRAARYETEVLVDHIRGYCASRYALPRQICLPPLPEAEALPLGDLLQTAPAYARWFADVGWEIRPSARQQRLVVPVGMIDMPAQQTQRPFLLDLNAKDGNFIVVGPAGSGKSLFLRTLVMSLAATHTPDDVIFYFLSRGTSLVLLEELPHCQAYIHPSEGERIARLFKFLEGEIARRTELMRQTKANHFHALRQTRQDMALPSLVIIIEDFASFLTDQFDRLQDMVNLAAAARLADVHFILATTAMSGIHAKVQQHMQNRLALSPSSTLDVFMQRANPLPEISGRGYIQDEQALVECQIASPHWQKWGALPEVVSMMKTQWRWPDGKRPLPPIMTLPKQIALQSLWQHDHRKPSFIEAPTAPLGVDYDLSEVWLNFDRLDAFNLVLGPTQSGKTDFLITLALAAAINFHPRKLQIVTLAFNKPRSTIRLLRNLPHVAYGDSPTTAEHILTTLLADLMKQTEQQKELAAMSADEKADITSYTPRRTLILVDDAQQFSRRANLNQLLDRCMEESSTAHVYLFVTDSGNNINQAKRDFNIKYMQTVCRHGSGLVFSTDQNDLALLNLMGKLNSATLKLHGPNIGNGRGFWTFQGQERVVQIGRVAADAATIEAYETALETVIAAITEKYPPNLSVFKE
jgi:DNA segregation ATPase FtsK/SpoIIIE, S-DNA-T family